MLLVILVNNAQFRAISLYNCEFSVEATGVIFHNFTWRSVKVMYSFKHHLLFVVTEMHRSVHQTLSLLMVFMKHRTRLVKMINLSTMLYNSVTHNMVLMLVIMTHWTHKHKENNLNMTSYHDLRQIRMRRITSIWHVYDSCSLVLQAIAMLTRCKKLACTPIGYVSTYKLSDYIDGQPLAVRHLCYSVYACSPRLSASEHFLARPDII